MKSAILNEHCIATLKLRISNDMNSISVLFLAILKYVMIFSESDVNQLMNRHYCSLKSDICEVLSLQ